MARRQTRPTEHNEMIDVFCSVRVSSYLATVNSICGQVSVQNLILHVRAHCFGHAGEEEEEENRID